MHCANSSNSERCFVRLLKKYREYRPSCDDTNCSDAFYLTPIGEPKGKVWYKIIPIGVNTLHSTVARLCERGDIEGYKTNHSLLRFAQV